MKVWLKSKSSMILRPLPGKIQVNIYDASTFVVTSWAARVGRSIIDDDVVNSLHCIDAFNRFEILHRAQQYHCCALCKISKRIGSYEQT